MAHKERRIRVEWHRKYYERNREALRASQKEWRNSEAGAAYRFRRTLKTHGITQEIWDAAWDMQGGKCAGCMSGLVLGADTHIDHCHATGAFRGILCASCNLALGKVKDSASTLRRLAQYLDGQHVPLLRRAS